MKCVACGSTALVEGTIIDAYSTSGIMFKPKDTSAWRIMLGSGTRQVRAYGCIHCSHLQLAVEFSDEDFSSYQQFEGEQPGVLERINSEAQKDRADLDQR